MELQAAILLSIVLANFAAANVAPPRCDSLPRIIKAPDPGYPPDVESRGLPNPVWVNVEFTIQRDGTVSGAIVRERNAGSYEREFADLVLKTITTVRFEKIQTPCRGKIRVAFKLAG